MGRKKDNWNLGWFFITKQGRGRVSAGSGGKRINAGIPAGKASS